MLAPWLDLTGEFKIRRCFKFRTEHGKLGVLRNRQEQMHFRDIPGRFAMVTTATTKHTGSYVQKFEDWTGPSTNSSIFSDDDSTFDHEVMLVQTTEDIYQAMIRVRSGTTLRVIDPLAAIIQVAQSNPVVECHHQEAYQKIDDINEDVKFYSFEDLLGRWQGKQARYGSISMLGSQAPKVMGQEKLTYHVTTNLKEIVKINTVRALSVGCLVVMNKGKCCLPCALDKLRNTEVGTKTRSTKDAYIINCQIPSKQVARRSN